MILDQVDDDEKWMHYALGLADSAAKAGEVPVGAILLRDDQILGEGWNRPISDCDPSGHAEIIALRNAANHVGNYRLTGSTLYVTLEPCVMCAGAILHARVARVVFGAYDPRAGAAGSVFNILQSPRGLHRLSVTGGVLRELEKERLRSFFRARR